MDGIRRPMLAPIQPIAAPRVSRTRDDDAFRALVAGRLDAAYRLASVVLGDATEAEDAAHDAVVRAWRSFGSLRDTASFDAWFQRIVVSVTRTHRCHQPVAIRSAGGIPGPADTRRPFHHDGPGRGAALARAVS